MRDHAREHGCLRETTTTTACAEELAFSLPPPSLRCTLVVFLSAMTVVFFFCIVVVVVWLELGGISALNLTCYTCSTKYEHDPCYTNVSAVPTQVCDPDIPSMTCSVYREDTAGKFTYISRACNSSCVAKCGAWGEVVDIDKCSSCCTSDLCNIDDAASSLWTAMIMRRFLLLLLWAVVVGAVDVSSVVDRGS